MTFGPLTPGIQQVTLNLRELYPDKQQRERFQEQFPDFLKEHKDHPDIFQWSGDTVIYQTECIIPEKQNGKPSLLLLLGNPASHSVHSGMFFAYEGDKKEHRFWKALSKVGILTFTSPNESGQGTISDSVIEQRRESLFNLSYESPFRIGLAVFYSMPSAASGKLSGVERLRSLFGRPALREIAKWEKCRVNGLIKKFASPNGAVIAFQKDAYERVKSANSPDYILNEAKNECLKGYCQCDPCIRLFCCPPTRWILGGKSLDLLRSFTEEIQEGKGSR
jgi:hypothetical protein